MSIFNIFDSTSKGDKIMTTLTPEKDLQNLIQTDLDNRVLEYQKKIQEMQINAFEGDFGTPTKLNFIADGDSWFDYPTSAFGNRTDIITQMDKKFSNRINILNLAHYGNATTQLLGVSKRQRLIKELQNNNNGKFDAILFSGGGNDIAGDQFCLWVNEATSVGNNPKKGLNQVRLNNVLDIIKSAYEDLIKIRNDYAAGIPIFTHGYDFAIPNGVGAMCDIGPWLEPSLSLRGWIGYNDKVEIIKAALQQFDQLLADISSDPANNLNYIHTQGILNPVTDWDNELHPTKDGFRRILDKFIYELKIKFPGRI